MTRPVDVAAAWTVTLPGPAGQLAATPGGCAVAGAEFVAVVRDTGELGWWARTEPGLRRGLAALPDGRVANVEGDHVVVRRPGGAVSARWDGLGVHALAAAPDGDVVHVRWSHELGTSLVKVGPDGVPRGSVRLAARAYDAPFVTRDLIVVAEGNRVRVLDHGGNTLWTATRDQLTRGEPPPDAPAGDAVREPVTPLGDGRFVVDFAEDIGYVLHIVNPHAGLVYRLAPDLAAQPPVVAVPDGSGRIAALATAKQRTGYDIVSFSADGAVEWTRPALASPATLLADATGRVIVVGPLTRGGRRDTADEPAVRCLAPDGTEAWAWHPPGPLTAEPVLAGGVLYAVTGDTLWALRP